MIRVQLTAGILLLFGLGYPAAQELVIASAEARSRDLALAQAQLAAALGQREIERAGQRQLGVAAAFSEDLSRLLAEPEERAPARLEVRINALIQRLPSGASVEVRDDKSAVLGRGGTASTRLGSETAGMILDANKGSASFRILRVDQQMYLVAAAPILLGGRRADPRYGATLISVPLVDAVLARAGADLPLGTRIAVCDQGRVVAKAGSEVSCPQGATSSELRLGAHSFHFFSTPILDDAGAVAEVFGFGPVDVLAAEHLVGIFQSLAIWLALGSIALVLLVPSASKWSVRGRAEPRQAPEKLESAATARPARVSLPVAVPIPLGASPPKGALFQAGAGGLEDEEDLHGSGLLALDQPLSASGPSHRPPPPPPPPSEEDLASVDDRPAEPEPTPSARGAHLEALSPVASPFRSAPPPPLAPTPAVPPPALALSSTRPPASLPPPQPQPPIHARYPYAPQALPPGTLTQPAPPPAPLPPAFAAGLDVPFGPGASRPPGPIGGLPPIPIQRPELARFPEPPGLLALDHGVTMGRGASPQPPSGGHPLPAPIAPAAPSLGGPPPRFQSSIPGLSGAWRAHPDNRPVPSSPDPFASEDPFGSSDPPFASPDRPPVKKREAMPRTVSVAELEPLPGAAEAHAQIAPFDLEHYRQVFEDYVEKKKTIGESTASLTLESFGAKLRKSEKQLMDRHGCRAVRYQVLIRDGQVSLRPQLVR